MGLFDSYQYDPESYSGQGGLLGRLLSQVQAGGYDPSQASPGFPPSPMDANASAAPPPVAAQPAGPINTMDIGGYQMPQFGSAADYTPPALPPQVANAQAQAPAPDQSSGIAQAAGTVGNHIAAALQSLGAPGSLFRHAISDPVSALITGQRSDATGVAQQNLQFKVQALVNAGVPHDKAILAAIDPEYGKELAKNFGPQTVQPLANGYVWDPRVGHAVKAYEPEDKFQHVMLKNMDGSETPQAFDPSTGKYSGAAQPPAGTGGLGNMDLTGKEYLASLPKSEANIVQQMVEGTIAPPSSFALGKPAWVNRLAAAKNYDPTFDAANWSGRVAGVKDFSAGKSSEMVRSANQTLHHTGALLDSMDALNNGDYPLINRAGNAINEASGGGAPTAFRLNAHAVADEMSKVFKGGNLSDSEIRSWEENLTPNMSPDQQRAAVGKLKDLLQGSLQALDEKRVASIGPVAADKAGPIIKPEGVKVLQRIDGWLKKGTGAAQGTTPAQTKTGVSWSVVQ